MLAAAVAPGPATRALAQTCEIPVLVSTGAKPNVLLAVDTSASMREVADFDATYPDHLYQAKPAGNPDYRQLFEDYLETLPADHPLWDMPNVLITPHIAAASPRIAERHLETLLENIRQFVQGEDPITLVDKHRWF